MSFYTDPKNEVFTLTPNMMSFYTDPKYDEFLH